MRLRRGIPTVNERTQGRAAAYPACIGWNCSPPFPLRPRAPGHCSSKLLEPVFSLSPTAISSGSLEVCICSRSSSQQHACSSDAVAFDLGRPTTQPLPHSAQAQLADCCAVVDSNEEAVTIAGLALQLAQVSDESAWRGTGDHHMQESIAIIHPPCCCNCHLLNVCLQGDSNAAMAQLLTWAATR